MNIVVIGAGIGGLAAARAMALRGADVRVLEQTGEIKEVGAGIQISPNGFRVLRGLDLDSVAGLASVEARAIELRDFQGRSVLAMDLAGQGRGDYHFLHRADLIDLLATGARDAGVKINLLQKVTRVSTGERPKITLGNGAMTEADLVIGADGLHSQVRRALNGTSEPFFTRQVAWRALIPNQTGRQNDVRVYMGPHRHLVSYPLRGGKLLNIVAVQERAEWRKESWSQHGSPDELRAIFHDFCPEAQEMLAAVDDVYEWGLFRHDVAKNWRGAGTAILGDAAHPTLPFMAQGASMALEDAWILADCLSHHSDMPAALHAYQQLRRKRCQKIVAAANGNAWKYHLAARPLRFALHSGLRVAGRLAPSMILRQFDWIYGYDPCNQMSKSTQIGT